MEYTSNYHLPQWVETDRIMMGDFNEAMASIEEGMSSNAAATESAQQEAEEKGFVIGSYTGNGAEDGTDSGQLINLGFRPRFVIITRGWLTSNSSTINNFLVIGQPRANYQEWTYQLKDSGFFVINHGAGTLALNSNGVVYDYVAFR